MKSQGSHGLTYKTFSKLIPFFITKANSGYMHFDKCTITANTCIFSILFGVTLNIILTCLFVFLVKLYI